INPERDKAAYYKNETNNPVSLSENTVNVIYQDSQSNIWVGTENGLNLYNPAKDEFIRFKADPQNNQSISSNRIQSIYEDKHQTLWIGTWSTGIDKFNYYKKGISHYYHNPKSK